MTSYYIHNTFTYLNKFVLNEKLNVLLMNTHTTCAKSRIILKITTKETVNTKP